MRLNSMCLICLLIFRGHLKRNSEQVSGSGKSCSVAFSWAKLGINFALVWLTNSLLNILATFFLMEGYIWALLCTLEYWIGEFITLSQINVHFYSNFHLIFALRSVFLINWVRRGSQVVRPRTANPLSSVRFRPAPPFLYSSSFALTKAKTYRDHIAYILTCLSSGSVMNLFIINETRTTD